MKGSITAREDKPNRYCRKWQLRVSIGKDAKTGKYKYKSKRVTGTYRDAQKALEEFVAECEGPDNSGITVAEYFRRWHEDRVASGNFAPRTMDMEPACMRNVLRHIGDIPLEALTAHDINRMYAALRNGDSLSGKNLSGSSCLAYHKKLMAMLHDADREDLLDPRLLKTIKSPKSIPAQKQALTRQQVTELLSKLDPEKSMHMMVILCVMCGLRRSEALAVTWDDVTDDILRINKDLNDDKTVKGCPKTAAGNRCIPLPRYVCDSLLIRRAAQLMEIGDKQTGATPIIDSFGGYYHPVSATMWWSTHKRDFGVDCTLHELRHTYATMLVEGSVDVKTVQTLLGHASPNVTLNIYSHVHDESLKKAATKIDELTRG